MKLAKTVLIGLLLAAPAAKTQSEGTRSLLDRLDGTWDVVYEIYTKDGGVRLYHGQAIYRRILDGGALEEIWTSDAKGSEAKPYSTTIGFRDAQSGIWTAVSIYPAKASVRTVSGDADGRMVLIGRDPDGTVQRWSVTDVQRDSFDWRFDSSGDEGKTWRVLGINHMHRHGP